MRGRHSEKSFPCFASQGQKQGKTELFMVADLQEMQENQRVSEIRIDKSEFVTSSKEAECLEAPIHLHLEDHTQFRSPPVLSEKRSQRSDLKMSAKSRG